MTGEYREEEEEKETEEEEGEGRDRWKQERQLERADRGQRDGGRQCCVPGMLWMVMARISSRMRRQLLADLPGRSRSRGLEAISGSPGTLTWGPLRR